MDVLTGPQHTPDERGDLAERAGLMGLHVFLPLDSDVWLSASKLYLLPGWEQCSAALTDHHVAVAYGLQLITLLR
ncbi:hypothetical protein AB0A77_01950 [Streptomyces varsoviensis]|uniref:hypothetical protein n=1 Tax=Streptomyces varsoviensis TaxID=67373 RepID=UPI0034091E27